MMHTCILGIAKKLWLQCVVTSCHAGFCRSETGRWGSPFEYCRGKCRTSSKSTVHENAYLDSHHHCFSQSGKLMAVCSARACMTRHILLCRHPVMGCMPQQDSCMTVMNSGQIMWHDAHLQIARLQRFYRIDCVWLLAKRRKVVHECKEAPVCRQAGHAIATCPSTTNKRQGRGWRKGRELHSNLQQDKQHVCAPAHDCHESL